MESAGFGNLHVVFQGLEPTVAKGAGRGRVEQSTDVRRSPTVSSCVLSLAVTSGSAGTKSKQLGDPINNQ